MGKIKRQTGRRTGYDYGVMTLALIVLVIIVAAFFTLPKLKSAIDTNRALKAELAAAEAELTKAQDEQAELTRQHTELATMDDDTAAIRDEAFRLAAKLEKKIQSGESNARICYITIDDGPYYRGNSFLRIFKKYDVKASFFLTTANGNILPDKGELTAASMYPKYISDGHTIGNHTYSHEYQKGGIYRSADAFMKDIEKQDKFIKKNTGGYSSGIVRFPGGVSTAGENAGAIKKALAGKKYGWVDWTIDTGDSGANRNDASGILSAVKKAAKSQDIMIVLCHEWSKDSEKAMPEIIEYLKGEGYIFLPLFKNSVMVEKH